jgi:hypothetical protein
VAHTENIMHRAQAVSSQRCTDKVNSRNYETHRSRLSTIKSSIDMEAPKMYPHLYQKLKKAQTEEERCATIERDNRTLVKRMTSITHRDSGNENPHGMVSSLNTVRRKQELERITRENHSLLKRIQERQPTYNHLQWEQDRDRNEQLCERICKFPYRPNGTAAPLDTSDELPPIDQ